MNKMKILYSFLFIFTLMLIFFAVQNSIAENNDQRLNRIEKRVETIERTSNSDKENVNRTLSISGNTITYVGIIAAIVLTISIFMIGYQMVRSSQFEKEIRETRKLMIDEYEKMVKIREEFETLFNNTKIKLSNLEALVGTLATDEAKSLLSEFKKEAKEEAKEEAIEQANQVLAEIITKQDELSKSIELMKKLEALDMTLTPTIYLERGGVYLGQKNFEKAIDSYNKAIELKPDESLAYFNRGVAYFSLNKYEEAIESFNKTIYLNPGTEYLYLSYVYIGMACRLHEANDYQKSLQNLNKAIELLPKYYLAYRERAYTYKELGKFDLAVADMQTSLDLKPEDQSVLLTLGLLYGRIGKYELARDIYLRDLANKVEKKQDTVSVKMNLTEIYICLKDYLGAEKTAKEVYQEATNIWAKILSQYLLVTTMILGDKEYDTEFAEWQSLVKIKKETGEFKLGSWTFDEILTCLEGTPKTKADLIRQMISLLK